MSTPIRVTKQDLEQKVQEGWKKDQLAEHYGLTVTAMGRLLKDAGLKIRKFHAPKYVLVDEVEDPQIDVTAEALIDEIEVEQPETVVQAEAIGATNAENKEVPQGW